MSQHRGRTWFGVLALGVAAATLTACDPPEPPPVFAVNHSAALPDAHPGDGICEDAPGSGRCSLRAALTETNALGGGEIHLTQNSLYSVGSDPVPDIAGKTTIVAVHPDAEVGRLNLVVPAGSTLHLEGVVHGYAGRLPPEASTFAIEVQGTLVTSRSALDLFTGDVSAPAALTVAEGGVAILESTVVETVINAGLVVARHSSLPSVSTTGAGATHVSSSLLYNDSGPACSGTPVVSHGYNIDRDGACGLDAPGDQPGVTVAFELEFLEPARRPVSTSPAVDAIPVGAVECGRSATIDIYRNVRPSDGNDDGTDGCDVGPVERP